MQVSYPNMGKSLLPAIANDELGEKVSETLIPYTRKQVANAGRRTEEAAKAWKAGRAAPDGASLLNLGRALPPVDWLIRGELDRYRGGPERYATELVTSLLKIAEGDGEIARRARTSLQEISRLLKSAPEASAQASPGLMHASGGSSVPPDATTPLETGGSQLSRASGSFPEGRPR